MNNALTEERIVLVIEADILFLFLLWEINFKMKIENEISNQFMRRKKEKDSSVKHDLLWLEAV